MDEIIRVWDMLWDIYSKAEGTPWENTIPIIVVGAVLFLLVKWIIIPLGINCPLCQGHFELV